MHQDANEMFSSVAQAVIEPVTLPVDLFVLVFLEEDMIEGFRVTIEHTTIPVTCNILLDFKAIIFTVKSAKCHCFA